MAAADQTELALGARAPDFRLPATDGRTYALGDVAGHNGTVVVFICNHCPYVKAVIGRLTADARLLMSEGVGFAAISSNDFRQLSLLLWHFFEGFWRFWDSRDAYCVIHGWSA